MSVRAVLSDIHFHDWSLFSHINPDGVNSRLQVIIDEALRAATVLKAAGGRTMIWSGDIFQTRGVINPEVLNPVRKLVWSILEMGISIFAIPGNHDLKSRDTEELSSAIQNLAQKHPNGAEFVIFNKVTAMTHDGCRMGFVPWRWKHEDLFVDLEILAKDANRSDMDVFIHVGIEGVIPGLSAGGMTDRILGKFGFRNIFAGDYHNHKVMEFGVCSVGATTHQSWGDVGSKAGFLLLDDNGRLTFNDTHAPKFVDVSGKNEDEIQMECDGNYVRFRGPAMTQTDINALKEQFREWGALGTSIEVPKVVAATRASASPSAGLSLNQSVESYIDAKKDIPAHVDRAVVKHRAAEVLVRAQTVSEAT